jgi:hypothetical protein
MHIPVGNFYDIFIFGMPMLIIRIHKLVLQLIKLMLLHANLCSPIFSHYMAGHERTHKLCKYEVQ